MRQNPMVHSTSPVSTLICPLLSADRQVGHFSGAASTSALPCCISPHTSMSTFTERGQLKTDMGNLDRAASTSSLPHFLTKASAAPPVPREMLRQRNACTHEKPAAVSQKEHDVDFREHSTGATTW